MATYEIKKSGDKFHFNLKAGNGQVILTGQRYADMNGCRNGVESVRVNSNSPAQFETNEAKDGSLYFILKATNGQIIGQSEMYTSKAACDNGIQSVMKNGPSAIVKEV